MKAILGFMLMGFGGAVCLADSHYAAQAGQVPASPYGAWANAASNIQDAVNAASAGDTVWVGSGHYSVPANAVDHFGTNVVYINKPLTLRASGSVADTVIDGEGLYRCVGAYYGGTSASGIVLDGFTLTNGLVSRWGGGLWFAAKNPGDAWTGTALNCLVTDCSTVSSLDGVVAYGGGIAMVDSSADGVRAYYLKLLVSNCVVRSNVATNTADARDSAGGGIIYRGFKGASVLDSLVEDNSAGAEGGGIYLHVNASLANGPLKVSGCTIRNNAVRNLRDANSGGGGLFMSGPSGVLNSLFHGNVARGGPTDYFSGGGCFFPSNFAVTNEHVDLYNCTIVSNSAYRGGGLSVRDWSGFFNNTPLTLHNTIVVSNAATYRADLDASSDSRPHTNFAYHSCFPVAALSVSIQAGAGNLHVSPEFADFTRQDFRLRGGSLCVNAGTNQDWMAGATDLDGNRRIDRVVGTVDIGCYEYPYSGTVLLLR